MSRKQVISIIYYLVLGRRTIIRHWSTWSWRLYKWTTGQSYWCKCYIATQWSDDKVQYHETRYWNWGEAHSKIQLKTYFGIEKIGSETTRWVSGWILPQNSLGEPTITSWRGKKRINTNAGKMRPEDRQICDLGFRIKGWKLLFKWKDRTQYWIPFKDPK